MCLMVGFIGFMAHTFSKSTVELDGIKLVKLHNLEDEIASQGKVCVAVPLHSDNTFEMPDTKQNVIKGRLHICAVWPDGSKSILLDWQKESKYLRISDGQDSRTETTISPKQIECINDSAFAKLHTRIENTTNETRVEYFQYKFNITGCYTKGHPRIEVIREYLEDGTNVSVTFSKTESRTPQKGQTSYEVVSVVPYETALNREFKLSQSKTLYIVISVIGLIMFLIPEEKANNTLTMMKDMLRY